MSQGLGKFNRGGFIGSSPSFHQMKQHILNEINQAGVSQVFEKHPAWKKAFEYYWQETGDHNLKMGCSMCYKKILEWLKK